jgi:hypothetical protein
VQVAVASPADAPPAAALVVTVAGPASLAVTADASASSDTDATPIATYRFDFGDGTPPVGPQSGALASHTYGAAGTYTVTVVVTDLAGLTSSALAAAKLDFVRNPGFELDTAGWQASGTASGITLARVAGGHSGTSAARVANTGVAGGSCILDDAPNWVAAAAAGTYHASVWVRGDVAGAKLKLTVREYNGTTLVGSQSQQVTLGTSWQRVAVSYAPLAPGASTLDLKVSLAKAPSGTCFYADDASITLDRRVSS